MAIVGGPKEDPIEEDESDIVSARIVKKPWTRTSSPPRRLQTSMSLRGSAANQGISLPPHLRTSGSYAAKGQPITLQRLTNDSSPSNGLYSQKKLNNSARFGAFKPWNNLSRSASSQPYSRRTNGLSGTKATTEEPPNKRRKVKEWAGVSDEEEDELAGPGLDRERSSSPTKIPLSTEAVPNLTNSKLLEQNTLPAISLDQSLAEPVSGDGRVLQIQTPKQKREHGRQQRMLRNQKQKLSETTSPYFSNDPDITHNDSASPQQRSNKALENSDTFNGAEPQSLQVSPPSEAGNQVSSHKRDSTSIDQDLLRRHLKSWHIKGFQSEKHSYEQGFIELLADKRTKKLYVRVDSQLKSDNYPMDTIFEVKFSSSLIRLHFRGRVHRIAWITTQGNAEAIIKRLQEIQHFQARSESRLDQMLARWNLENKQSMSNNKRPPVSPDELSEQYHFDNVSKTKRQKMAARLIAETTPDDLTEPSAISGEKKRNKSILPADVDYCDSRELLSRSSPNESKVGHMLIEMPKSAGAGMMNEANPLAPVTPPRPSDSPLARAQKQLRHIEEYEDLVKKQGTRASNRPPRSTRAQRQHAELEQYESVNPVEKYSKTHGLGPRWTQPLVWPKNGRKRVTVEFDDLERLDEEEFLNDNLVEFTLRWLRQQANDPPNIYWFNTYFFERLNKGKGKQIDYDGVKRWTKDIDLFAHDCIVVPINENYHWYLAIIYNLPQLKKKLTTTKTADEPDPPKNNSTTSNGFDDSTTLELLTQSISLTSPRTPIMDKSALDRLVGFDESLLVNGSDLRSKSTGKARGRARDPLAPIIITLDSLGFAHPQAITTLRSYLRAEAHERLGLVLEKDDIAGMTAKGIPSQDNLSDCGIYLLGYAAVMLHDSDAFRNKLLQKDFDEETDWQYLQPKALRSHLRRVIRKKYEHQVRRASKKFGICESSEELSSELSSDDVQSLGPMLLFKKRADRPRSNHNTPLKQQLEIDMDPKKAAEDVAGLVGNSYPTRENTPLSAIHVEPQHTTVSQSIRVKPFDESSPPLLNSQPLSHQEVPETPGVNPTRKGSEANARLETISHTETAQQKTVRSSPSSPLSATSSVSQTSLIL